jgi:hypothetical protein
MRGHMDMEDAASDVFQEDKDLQEPEGCRDHHTEITRHDAFGLVADKGGPALRRYTMPSAVSQALWHGLPYGAWRYPQAQLEQEFVRNALLTPRRVLTSHMMDKGLEFRRNGWSSGARFPPPEQAESLAMPMEKRLGLHYRQGLPPVEPATEPDKGKARRVGGTPRLDVSLLIQRELFTQKEILCGQCRAKAQAESEKAHGINHKREQHGHERYEVTKSV